MDAPGIAVQFVTLQVPIISHADIRAEYGSPVLCKKDFPYLLTDSFRDGAGAVLLPVHPHKIHGIDILLVSQLVQGILV